ncbi:sulfoxide reductase heme-binding subunit YedZ [Catenovulum sp. 2E275]|uniref:sulfite oxidase heme-binding subunit YedZ n=1 Tax=Catenovulum sp. 2E275 TaxID=2980497 RepID=UPI0021D1CA3E|nr:protein-methionine-sulfoxide reductase heme-binding subunit MsrQ [Catenovulum sp. 2E275]MCU4676134.1 sulfoxide reductase heme-binding subunit YedZ [Catenovulum sp. 2E275]
MKIQTKVLLSKILIHFFALSPLLLNYFWSITDQNGADPVKAIIHFTGIGALNLLLITLLISPCAKFLKQGWLMQLRRLIGLYSFFYALCHVINFWLFELNFQISLFLQELIKRPYIWLGMAAFTILLLLAVTSINYLRRKLGQNWQRLHYWIYPASLLIWIHFYWSRKADLTEPFIYLALIIILLACRPKKLKNWLLFK